jgi:hypothetical protein
MATAITTRNVRAYGQRLRKALKTNPIYERKHGHEAAQARAQFQDPLDNDELGIIGVQTPAGEVVYGDPAEGESAHEVLYAALSGKPVEEQDYGIEQRYKGGLQFRVWPLLGDINVYGLDTADGWSRAVRLVKTLQVGNPPFRRIEIHLLNAKNRSGRGRWLSYRSVGEMERESGSLAKTNPGILQRFAGGVLGKAQWILPFEEFVGRVRDKMVRHHIHPAGQPLEPDIVEALRELYDEAAEVYRSGGPEAIGEWMRRRKNPIDLVTLLGLGVIAGAVQGIVEPYVTRHVYRMDRSLAGTGGAHAA